jgi:transcriptional regulator with XRE-family HTH domain
MIHKKILDIARSNPDASLESIAGDVGGASAVFVERVLEEYGDPAPKSSTEERADGNGNSHIQADKRPESENSQSPPDSSEKPKELDGDNSLTDKSGKQFESEDDTESLVSDQQDDTETATLTQSDSSTPSEFEDTAEKTSPKDSKENPVKNSEVVTDPSELSDKQIETLQSVHQDPAATQEEIADKLGVTRATISKRLTDISGFNWKTRREFVDTLFEDSQSTADEPETNEPAPREKVSALESRIDELEAQLEAASSSGSESPLGPELTHKVIHSCMSAEYLSEEEELQLLRELL